MTRHLDGSTLGAVPADTVSAADVTEWIDGLTTPSGTPASWRAKANLAGLLSSAYQRQVREGALTRNPAVGALGKRTDLPERDPVLLSTAQLRAIRTRARAPLPAAAVDPGGHRHAVAGGHGPAPT